MTISCYQVRNYWLSVPGLFFNELVNDFVTIFFLAVSSFALRCLRALKENSAQKGPVMDSSSVVRSLLKSFTYIMRAAVILPIPNTENLPHHVTFSSFVQKMRRSFHRTDDSATRTYNPESYYIRPWAQILGFWLTRLCNDVSMLHNHDSFCCDTVIPMSRAAESEHGPRGNLWMRVPCLTVSIFNSISNSISFAKYKLLQCRLNL